MTRMSIFSHYPHLRFDKIVRNGHVDREAAENADELLCKCLNEVGLRASPTAYPPQVEKSVAEMLLVVLSTARFGGGPSPETRERIIAYLEKRYELDSHLWW